ncbi:hypothetical protein [uncultured Fretibacterium sp.]|uniref:hypothetical protein n=1 Tax=uncultured Fretibacterium sp. TaxID=1678694 RepID=UPI00325FAF02
MICKNLAYWVFTSGEEGVHGLDWGIKHASKSFADRYKLDSRYRSLLKAFRLLPSLERPRKGAGLILLPWQGGGKDRDEETLMGFIFPGSDHKGRPNISTVACVVPADVVRALTPSHVTRALWSSNDLERIAQKNTVRPDTLYLDAEKTSSTREVPLPLFPSLKWPGKDVGYLMVDGHVRDLRGLYPPFCPPAERAAKKRKLRMPQLAALLMALALTFGVACCWGSIRDFFQKYLIQPVCSLWNGGDASPSTDSSEDLETTERRAKRKENLENIIDILSKNKKNKGEDYLKGLAGLIWYPDLWKEEASFSSDDLIVEAISKDFTEKLKNEKWLVEKGDKGGRGGQKKKLINERVFKEKLKNTVLSPLGKDLSLVEDKTDKRVFFSISPKEEDWDSLKNDLSDQLSRFIDTMKNPGISLESATQPIAEDKQTLEGRLDELLKKSDAHKDKGFGYLSFFYGEGKEGYQVLLLNMEKMEKEALSEGKEPDEYIFVKKDNWRRIDVSNLGERLDGTSQKEPYIEFYDKHKSITFFLAPKSNREKDGDFEKFLGVFLDDLLESVSVEE